MNKMTECPHEDWITFGKTISETETEKVIEVTCDDCRASGWIREETISGDNYQLEEHWNE